MITLDRANAIFGAENLGPHERLVWLYIAHCANSRTGTAFPSTASIVRATGVSKRTVHRAIQTLEVAGMLTRTRGRGRGQTNHYTIPEASGKGATQAPQDNKKVPNRPLKGAKFAAEKVPQWHKEQRRELGNEQSRARAREAAAPSSEFSQGAAPASPSANLELSNRERLLAAIGVGPDGVTGPANFIGTEEDMVEARRWSEMGASIDRQCSVIFDTCRRKRLHDPNWVPRRFRYFTGAMNDAVNAHSRSPELSYARNPQGETLDQQRARWRKMAQQK